MSEDTMALVPVEQRTVEFYEDEIPAVVTEVEGQRLVFVPVRPICDLIGVDWSAQRQRINRDPVLSEVVSGVVVTPTPVDNKYANPQEMLCIPLEYLNGWLFGINANRVKEEVRGPLIRYQKECYQVLAAAFLGPEPLRETLTPNEASLIQIREMGLAIVRMAEQQLELERRTMMTEQRMDQAAQFVGQMNRRLKVLERRVAPGEELTAEQSFEIKERVTEIALEMARHDPGKSHFAEVYRSLSLQTRRSSYKDIPQGMYEATVQFLDEWLMALREEGEG